MTRREFVTRAALAAGAGVIAPFSFVRAASARTDELEQHLHRKLVEANTPGIAVAVVRGDEIVWSAGVGWADRGRRIRATGNSVFQLASVSKTVTCAGIMALVEDGLIDLDADVNAYLPFEVHIPHAPDIPITMRAILTHTSAIRDRWQVWGTPWSEPTLYFQGDSPISLGDFCRSYFVHGGSRYRRRKNFYERAPGDGYAYSNLAVALAGFVAEAASGVDFNDLCKQRVFEPLGMTDTGFRLADIGTSNLAMPYATVSNGDLEPIFHYGYPDYPDGTLRTSAAHLARWLGAFMNFGVFESTRVLDETNGARDQAQPDPRSRPLASRPDLVRAKAMGLPRDGTHRRRLWGEHADVLPARPRRRGRFRSPTRTWAAVGGRRSATSSATFSRSSPDRPWHE